VQANILRVAAGEFANTGELFLSNFSNEQFDEVIQTFPVLRPLIWQKEIARFLLRPKILDLVITQLRVHTKLVETIKWVGEADLIEWWWVQVVEQQQAASARGRVLRQLAEKLSDRLASELSIDEFVGDEGILSSLTREGICQLVEGRLRFAHDLFGDWARQRQLLLQGPQLHIYLKGRLSSPPWHRALRLVGMHLAEQKESLKEWRALIAEFSDPNHESVLARDILLEAGIFAADAESVLHKIQPELVANDGDLLRRFLRRFLHSATIPDFRSVEFFRKEDPDLATEIAARSRLPFLPYWPPVLRWLHNNIQETIALAPVEVGKIAKLWLTVADGQILERKLAAELAVTNAERIVPFEFSGQPHIDDDAAKIIYAAAVSAAGDLPERVSRLALILCGRRVLEKSEIPPDADAETLGKESRLSGEVIRGELADDPPRSWPDGPQRPVSDTFQETFLQESSGLPLIIHPPDVAAEVTLALIISWPKTRVFRSALGPGSLTERHGFQFLDQDESFYTSGPFLLFLRNQPKAALSLILRLVNFATERCSEVYFGNDETGAGVKIPFETGERTWSGDWRVYFWFRYPFITVPIVGAALMALEKWLYECLEAGKSLDEEIRIIIEGSNSVAFAGVLICAGKRNPELLTRPLREFLAVRDFYIWDEVKGVQYKNINASGYGHGESNLTKKLKVEWEQMPHRGISLNELSRRIFLIKPETRELFERVKALWMAQASKEVPNSQEALSWLRWAAAFTLENYTEKTRDGQTFWEFQLPEGLRDRGAEQQAGEENSVMRIPFWSRQILDQEQRLPEEHLLNIWNLLQDVSKRPPPKNREQMRDHLLHPAHAVAGLIAVLVVLHRDWLLLNPEREKWCREKFSELLRSPPDILTFDPHEPVDCQFDGFAAQIIPVFWAEQPDSRFWREQVVSFALCSRLRSVELLSHAVALNRPKLGTSFQDFQSLLLRMSVARLVARRQQFSEKKAFKWPTGKKEWGKKFVQKKMPAVPTSWRDIAIPEVTRKRPRWQDDREVRRSDFDLDLDFLLSGFSWVGRIETLRNDDEREEWKRFDREALECVLRTFPENIKDNEKYSGTPYQTDRQVFKRIASLLLQLRPTEHPEELWRPILDLGSAAHYWVSDFLNSFLAAGLKTTPVTETFKRTWKSMLDYVFASAKWFENGRFRTSELWQDLLGQDWLIRPMWVKEHESLIQEMKPYFERWAKEQLESKHELRTFFHFLETDAAACLVCDALVWITPLLREADEWFWDRDDDRNEFASFLRHVWDKHWNTVKNNASALEGFKTLSAKLTAYQNPVALEISSRVAGGS
jgi:hypothetical protein